MPTTFDSRIDPYPHEPQPCIDSCSPDHHQYGGYHCMWCKEPWPCTQLYYRAVEQAKRKDDPT